MAGEIAEAEARTVAGWVPSYLVGVERDMFMETLHRAGKDLRPVGEALKLRSNGVQVLLNERLGNGACSVKVSQYGKAPGIPAGVPDGAQVFRWRDEDVPMFFLYCFWMEVQDESD